MAASAKQRFLSKQKQQAPAKQRFQTTNIKLWAETGGFRRATIPIARKCLLRTIDGSCSPFGPGRHLREPTATGVGV